MDFCRRKEGDVALFLLVTKIRKSRKICEAILSSRLMPETGRSQSNEPWNTKQSKRSEIQQSRITNHDLLNSCVRGPLRWWTEQKKLKFLRSLQNAQSDATNFAIRTDSVLFCFVLFLFVCLFILQQYSRRFNVLWNIFSELNTLQTSNAHDNCMVISCC